MSALQADVKSLKADIEESIRNEQKALADCRTLQEAVKEMSSLESSLVQKNSKIKSLEMEVRVILFLRTNILCHVLPNSHFFLKRCSPQVVAKSQYQAWVTIFF